MIEETLSPTWDEMLIFNAVFIPGTLTSIRSTPPTVVVEVFDQDRGVYRPTSALQSRTDDTIRYDTRCYFNVRSKADMIQQNLPHGDDN